MRNPVAEGGQQKFIEGMIAHAVILNGLSIRRFIRYVVWRVRHHEVCLHLPHANPFYLIAGVLQQPERRAVENLCTSHNGGSGHIPVHKLRTTSLMTRLHCFGQNLSYVDWPSPIATMVCTAQQFQPHKHKQSIRLKKFLQVDALSLHFPI